MRGQRIYLYWIILTLSLSACWESNAILTYEDTIINKQYCSIAYGLINEQIWCSNKMDASISEDGLVLFLSNEEGLKNREGLRPTNCDLDYLSILLPSFDGPGTYKLNLETISTPYDFQYIWCLDIDIAGHSWTLKLPSDQIEVQITHLDTLEQKISGQVSGKLASEGHGHPDLTVQGISFTGAYRKD